MQKTVPFSRADNFPTPLPAKDSPRPFPSLPFGNTIDFPSIFDYLAVQSEISLNAKGCVVFAMSEYGTKGKGYMFAPTALYSKKSYSTQ
jgi:hypothetical protein